QILERMTIAWQSEPDAPLELVFWSYGASVPALIIHGNQQCPWLAYMATLPAFPMIWSGMDQFYTLAIGMRNLRKERSYGASASWRSSPTTPAWTRSTTPRST